MKEERELIERFWDNGNRRYEIPLLSQSCDIDGICQWWNEDASIDQIGSRKGLLIHGFVVDFEY